MFEKSFNRLRKRIAKAMEPTRVLPTRHTHTAYPEIHVDEVGNWALRLYAYEPVAWRFLGHVHQTRPDFPEPELRHPNTYAEGLAPAENVVAWRDYYAKAPTAITLLDELTGREATEAAAKKKAYAQMRKILAHYRRQQP